MASKPDIEALRTLLRGRELRATPSRLAVLQFLREHARPMSHAEIAGGLAAGPWDPATIYRNLLDLVEAGLARRTDVGDHVWRFEIVGEGDGDNHPHFVCMECGVVECLPDVELVVPKTTTPRAVRSRKVELQLRGLCDGCI